MVRDYGSWVVLAGVLVYLYLQFFPVVDLEDPGRPAPSFSAQTVSGEPFDLGAHRGKVVVVNVWATWCPPCRVELPGFVDLQAEMSNQNVQFVGIAVDREGASAVRPFVEERGVNFPQIANPQLAARHFPGSAVPRTYLIDPQGRIRYSHTGLWMASSLRDAIEQVQDAS